jgi:cell division cycle protein 20 (cofactor of APC complex)
MQQQASSGISTRKTTNEPTGCFPTLKRDNIPPPRIDSISGGNAVPLKSSGDRFIPHRGSMKQDIAHFKLTTDENEGTMEMQTESGDVYKSEVSYSLFGDDIENAKILQLKAKPAVSLSITNQLETLCNRVNLEKEDVPRAFISTSAERVLDAPNLRDDFYLSLLDWSTSNMIALALEGAVYTWNPVTMEANMLVDYTTSKYISSVSWSGAASQYIALGTSTSEIQIWDTDKKLQVRSLTGHSARVGCLSWNNHILSSGSLDSNIINYDLRIPSPIISDFRNHDGEVCGLKWSPDGSKLASGGNDNRLNIWQLHSPSAPLFTKDDHQACVRALAWCPWRIELLASGGGSADRSIKYWNTATGACLNSIDTESQVSSLTWSRHTKEIISAHGFSKYSLIIWKYPSMTSVAELLGHEQRVLHVSLSPDGSTVVSASADETLRFWHICDTITKNHSNTNNNTTTGLNRPPRIR